jgi:hypothetical protein
MNEAEKIDAIRGLLTDYYANAYRTGDGEVKGHENGHELITESAFAGAYLRAIDDIVKRDVRSAAKDGVIVSFPPPVDASRMLGWIHAIREGSSRG